LLHAHGAPDETHHERAYARLLDEIRREFPGFRVVRKDHSAFQRFLGGALAVVTFGAQRGYLTSYQTTIGQAVYVTADWDTLSAAQRYITMRHEREHLRQFRRFTPVGMGFLYLFGPLPLGLSWFRASFEKQGYAETIRATAEVYGLSAVVHPDFRAYVVAQFTTGAYGWMWPFRGAIERWYDETLATLTTATGSVPPPGSSV